MTTLDDKIEAMLPPEQMAALRAHKAMDDYRLGRDRGLKAIIAYGDALLDGRRQFGSNKAFAQWVTDNSLDKDKPWSDRKERHAAMQLADIAVVGTTTDIEIMFKDCPNSTPTNIMKWYRALPGGELTEARKASRKKPGRPSKATVLVTTTAEDEAIAALPEKSRMTIERAIAILSTRLEKQFDRRVELEVRKRIQSADDAARKQLMDANRELLFLRQQRNLR